MPAHRPSESAARSAAKPRARGGRVASAGRCCVGRQAGRARSGRMEGTERERRESGRGVSRFGIGQAARGLGRGGVQAAPGPGKPLRGLGGRVRGRVGVSLARVRS